MYMGLVSVLRLIRLNICLSSLSLHLLLASVGCLCSLFLLFASVVCICPFHLAFVSVAYICPFCQSFVSVVNEDEEDQLLYSNSNNPTLKGDFIHVADLEISRMIWPRQDDSS